MKTVIIKRIKLKTVFKIFFISSVLSIGMIFVFSIIIGLIFSLFTRSTDGTSVLVGITQLLILFIPYIVKLLIFMLFCLLFTIFYHYFAPRFGGFEIEVDKKANLLTKRIIINKTSL